MFTNMFSTPPGKKQNNYKNTIGVGSSETERRIKKVEAEAKLQEKINEQNSELEELRQIKIWHSGLVEQYQARERENKELKDKDEKNLTKIEKQETEIKKYQAENSELKARISDCETKFQEKNQQKEQVIVTLKAIQNINEKEFNEKKIKLKEEIDEQGRQINGMNEKLGVQNKEIATLTAQLNERNDRIENLLGDLNKEKKINADLAVELAEQSKGHGSVLKCHASRASKAKSALIGAAVGGKIAAAGCIAALAFIHATFPPLILVSGTIAIIALASMAGGLIGYHASISAIKGAFYRASGADSVVVQNKCQSITINSDPRGIGA